LNKHEGVWSAGVLGKRRRAIDDRTDVIPSSVSDALFPLRRAAIIAQVSMAVLMRLYSAALARRGHTIGCVIAPVAASPQALLSPMSVSARWASTAAGVAARAGAAPSGAPQQSGPIAVEPLHGQQKTTPPPAAAAGSGKGAAAPPPDKCGPVDADLDTDDEADMVPMIDPKTGEWGGPTRGGTRPEPTRFGDWERKGRCTDFV
jgi:hypothetical protein